MDRNFYHSLTDNAINGENLSKETARQILISDTLELMPLVNAAYEVRKKFCGKSVLVHIINNAANGFCPEDCHYCAQAKSSKSAIEEYPLKPDFEILEEARQAYESGAHRYCMVFAGRGPSERRVEKLADLIRDIKAKYPLEICVSAGLLDENKAQILKRAGLDRLNHNLNTSEKHYKEICTTHTYDDRLETLQAAKKAGLQLCSGAIVGMGEEYDDILDVAYELRKLKAESIPVNFFIPIPGNTVKMASSLSPEFCLRVLCVYRFINPKAEIRIAAGREIHLRHMQALALYPANSLFMDGYLNTTGSNHKQTLQMIKDAGFTIQSQHNLDELLAREEAGSSTSETSCSGQVKNLQHLRPFLKI